MTDQSGNIAKSAIYGITDFIKGILQLKKIRKANRVRVEYIDINGLVHTGLDGIINDERTLCIIRGINRLLIATKIYYVADTLEPKVYASETSHKLIDMLDDKTYENDLTLTKLKPIFNELKNPSSSEYAKEKQLNDFTKLTLKDLGCSIDFEKFRTIKDKEHDFSADAYLVLSKPWFNIGQKEPPLMLIAMAIIGFLFGGVITAVSIIFLWFIVEVIRIVL